MTDISTRLPRRHNSLRLEDVDYNQPGAYFITITTSQRNPLLGKIYDGQMVCSSSGSLVWDVWRSLPRRYLDISIDAAVVMPDHFHGLIVVHDSVGAIYPDHPVGAIHESPLLRGNMTLSLIVGYFKMNSAKKINALRGTPGQKIWRRGYYDHILRDDKDYDALTEYILSNPQNWLLNKE